MLFPALISVLYERAFRPRWIAKTLQAMVEESPITVLIGAMAIYKFCLERDLHQISQVDNLIE